jgi:hypothetical protein
MRSLLAIVPVPRRLPFGGAVIRAGELQIRSIAALEAWAADQTPDPIDDYRLRIALAESEEERVEIAFEGLDAAEAGPPAFGSAAFMNLLATPDGEAEFTFIALRQHNRIDRPTAWALRERATIEEAIRLHRIAWGEDPLRELARVIEPVSTPANRPIPWAELYARVAAAAPVSPREFGRLTFSQVCLILSRGRPPEYGPTIGPGEDLATVARRRRELYKAAMARAAARRAVP